MTHPSRKPPQLWEPRGDNPHDHAANRDPAHGSAVKSSDQLSLACFDLTGFAEVLGLSCRTMTRLLAANLLPAPDLTIGKNQRRWTQRTVEAWLRTRPRFPGRGRKRGHNAV
jgi:hypothetical protein